jgi:hypothetical protein
VEHPTDDYQLKCLDYRLGADNVISQPMVELVHAQHGFGPAPVVQVMDALLNSFTVAYEDTLVALCMWKLAAEDQKAFARSVIELPEANRRNRFVRFGIGIQMPDGGMAISLAPG